MEMIYNQLYPTKYTFLSENSTGYNYLLYQFSILLNNKKTPGKSVRCLFIFDILVNTNKNKKLTSKSTYL